MTAKWKAFKVVNYIQFIFAIIFIGFLFVGIVNNIGEEGLVWGLFFMALFYTPIIANCLINLFIIRKYFSDLILTPKIKRIQNIVTFFYVLDILALIFLFISEISDNMAYSTFSGYEKSWLLCLLLLFCIWLMSLFILPIQLQIGNTLRKNNNKKIKNLIDSIGEEKQ